MSRKLNARGLAIVDEWMAASEKLLELLAGPDDPESQAFQVRAIVTNAQFDVAHELED